MQIQGGVSIPLLERARGWKQMTLLSWQGWMFEYFLHHRSGLIEDVKNDCIENLSASKSQIYLTFAPDL
jgi:hypothetical protein